MRKLDSILFCFLLTSIPLQAQQYFQQKVNYDIQVKLNDQNGTLEGTISIDYTNNSPQILDKIGFHLWPNAYKNKSTDFAKQKRMHRSTKFQDAKPEQLGYIKDLHFTCNGHELKMELLKNQPDMAWVYLDYALLPGKTIQINTPFTVKIPYTFSRLGHVDETFQISQWYPKPAVFDHKGWHLMPYLDQGEFYSEFGNFNVKISVPKNYIVAATGVLQEESEKLFLEKIIQKTQESIASNKNLYPTTETSSTEYKTISYIAENVHDFAWFANKSFYVLKDSVTLESGKTVETWAFFEKTGIWDMATQYINNTIKFYSKHVGEYPWPQATAVESAISAGGGMEYPMITVLGSCSSDQVLDMLIAHEVGHNWFYGILATNERDHPYMDEGINSYYEARYSKQYYGKKPSVIPQNLEKWIGKFNQNYFLNQLLGRTFLDQHPDQHSNHFSPINYGTDVYLRAPSMFDYLEQFLGTKKFDQAMKSYYQNWKFKHPYPEDLRSVLEKETETNLSWLFDGYLTSDKKSDYSIKNINQKTHEVILKNTADIPGPITLALIKKDSTIHTQWVNGFTGTQNIKIPDSDFDRCVLDPTQESFDLKPYNNAYYNRSFLPRVKPVKMRILPVFENYENNILGITPLIGFNAYNKLMVGTFISSSWLPFKKFQWSLMPMYAFGTKDLVGKARIGYSSFFPDTKLHRIDYGLRFKKFGYQSIEEFNETLSYQQWSPYITFLWFNSRAKGIISKAGYQMHLIQDEKLNFNDTLYSKGTANSTIHHVNYQYHNPDIIHSTKITADLFSEFYKSADLKNQSYVRADFSLAKKLRIANKRYFDARLFVSFFPFNTQKNSSFIASRTVSNFTRGSVGLSYQAYLDYANEESFLGRTKASGLWSQQIAAAQGGMKLTHSISQRSNFGNSNKFVASINLSTDLPFKYIGKIIRPYFDAGIFIPATTGYNTSDIIAYSGGVQLSILRDYFSVYFPITHSKNIRNLYKSIDNHTYFQEITFSLSLKLPELHELFNFIQI
ncbi:MAG TPA: M1 family metallopeptidase [Saprospiraceae bacterium]|nr:M1 family metallopeptidase [Saprospiraceae bacterium]